MSDHTRASSVKPSTWHTRTFPTVRSAFVSHVVRLADRPIGLILAAMGAIVFSLLAAGRGPDRDSHDAVLTALRTIDLANSSLQRDVLQARSGYLNNYDPLVQSVIKLHEMVEVLSSEKLAIGTPNDEALTRLQESIETVETIVERFKTNNAMLQNSLRIFTGTLTDLQDRRADAAHLPALWMEIGNLMMRFLTHPEPELGKRISGLLGSVVPAGTESSTRLNSLVGHGQGILKVQPVVDRLVAKIQASAVSLRTQELQKAYLAQFGEITRRAYWSRLFLGAVAVSLCIYILFLAYRLRLQSDRLSRRLRFERSRSLIKTVFDDDSSSGGTDAIRLGMEEISDLFASSGYAFVILNAETGNVEEQYQSKPPAVDIPNLAAEYFLETRGQRLDGVARGRAFYKTLHSHGDLAFSRDALSAGSAVGVPVSRRYAALMVLKYAEGRQRPSAEEVMFMEDALELVARCLDRLRKNQERDLLESRLAHSERLQAVGTLAAGIAHEFNNILVFMLGYGEMALQIAKPVAARRYIEGICSAGERARHIIDQILALSRKRERDVRPFDLREVVSETLSLLSVSMRDTRSVQAELPDEPVVIVGNPVELQQIIVNLCNNSMDATGGNGHIVIELGTLNIRATKALSHGVLPPGNYVRLSVTDDGPGISESDLPHIFEPFFTTRPLAGGTGLGLATVHGHTVAHDGFVNVATVLGKSTRFDLFFPASHRPPLPINRELDRDDLIVGGGQTVLLLEADDALRSMHEEKLAALSYEPKGFRSLLEVDEWLNSGKPRPEIAIIDIASLQPEVGKVELEASFESIPYLLIVDARRSGPLSASNLDHSITIRKPIDLRDLAATLKKLVESKKPATPAASDDPI
ncbi:two-component system VirA-like sensor kinase [Rhizobium leguminosarum]|uniref:two-component system VirA-like sensor kinase n=1 Tax=Rhizobium leguminosarum TaxID=384 RepID=UPI003F955BFE